MRFEHLSQNPRRGDFASPSFDQINRNRSMPCISPVVDAASDAPVSVGARVHMPSEGHGTVLQEVGHDWLCIVWDSGAHSTQKTCEVARSNVPCVRKPRTASQEEPELMLLEPQPQPQQQQTPPQKMSQQLNRPKSEASPPLLSASVPQEFSSKFVDLEDLI